MLTWIIIYLILGLLIFIPKQINKERVVLRENTTFPIHVWITLILLWAPAIVVGLMIKLKSGKMNK